MIIRQVIRLYTQGKKKYYISRNLGISRNTVDKYLAGFITHELDWDDISKMSDKQLMKLFEAPNPPPSHRYIGLDDEFKSLEKLLGKPGQTRHTYWLDYIKRKPDGYSRS